MGLGQILGESYRFVKLLIITVIFLSIFGSIYYLFRDGSNGGLIRTSVERLQGTTPIPANLPEKVSDERLKCRADTMLADFDGAAHRFDADKLRIIRTVAKYAQTQDVDECEIFRRQMELVPPGWGRRKFGIINVPDRVFGYIETTFSEAARDAALDLAKQAAAKPDPTWEAIVLVRPNRNLTLGNQKADELKKIRETMDLVQLTEPSDFQFFKPK